MDVPAFARHGLILVRDVEANPDDRRLRRDAESGVLVRLQRGVYMDAAEWREMNDLQRHVARVRAVASTSVTEHSFSHQSAAAVHGIPVLGGFPLQVHVSVPPGTTAHFRRHITAHRTDVPIGHLTRTEGLLVTNVCRTIVDLAVSESFPSAVAAVDWWLQRGDRSELLQCVDQITRRTGIARAEAAIRFGDPRSGSVGESLSRAVIHLLRLPAPELQKPFFDQAGRIGVVDFWWPEASLIGEFDGRGKYLREEFTQGREPGEVVVAEKVREDRLRAVGPRVVRWGWEVASNPVALGELLTRAGLRPHAASTFRLG